MRDDPVPGRARRRPPRRGATARAAFGFTAAPARAEVPGGVVRIGPPTDVPGGTAENSGQVRVATAASAARDAGGKAVGAPVEVIAAGRRNKPDAGAAAARRRLDREGVHTVVEPPCTRIARAGATVARERDRAVPGLRRAVPGADGQGAVRVVPDRKRLDPLPSSWLAATGDDGTADTSRRLRAGITGHRVRLGAPPATRGGRDRRRLGRGGHEGDGGGAGGVFRPAGDPNGDDARVLYNPALYDVESPRESRAARDDDRPVARLPAAEASRPLAAGGCPMPGET